MASTGYASGCFHNLKSMGAQWLPSSRFHWLRRILPRCNRSGAYVEQVLVKLRGSSLCVSYQARSCFPPPLRS
jgi:hypothetical protein